MGEKLERTFFCALVAEMSGLLARECDTLLGILVAVDDGTRCIRVDGIFESRGSLVIYLGDVTRRLISKLP
jgi:hypothetical protein